MLNEDYLRQLREAQTAEAEVDEDLRSKVDATNAVLDDFGSSMRRILMIQIRIYGKSWL